MSYLDSLLTTLVERTLVTFEIKIWMLDIAVEVHIFQGLFSWKNVDLSDISFVHDFNFQNNFSFMPCPSTSPKIFCAGPNFLSQSKNLIVFSGLFKNFCAGTDTKFIEWKSSFGVAQNVWDWHKM